jgi:Disulphide bond corrector protein DsbC
MQRSFLRETCCAGLCVLAVAACSKSEPKPAPAAPAAPAPVAEPKSAPQPSIEDNTFKLALVSEPEYSAGAPARLSLLLEAKGGYHVNQDYPIRVDLKAPAGVKLQKPSLGKPDAAEFGEHKARFEVPFSAEKGSHQLSADVDFAVCTPETCVPDQRTLAVSLSVK